MATTYNITLNQNASWEINLTLTQPGGAPFVLTSWTGKSEIRSSYGASTVLATATVTITDALNGNLKISLTPAQTQALQPTSTVTPPKPPLPVWDVLIANADASQVLRLMEGTVTVKPGVTHWT